MLSIELPLPPSVNSYWRKSPRGMYITQQGKDFRQQVAEIVAEQQAKERERAKRCYMSEFLNQQFVDHMRANGFLLAPDQCHERSAPTICQRAPMKHFE